MSTTVNYTKYTFRDRSGGIIDSRTTPLAHDFLVMGHTAFVAPWKDPNVHLHQHSEEFYLLLHGELHLFIAGAFVSLQPGELLMVLPQIPHAVIGGGGRIEHFGFRAPASNDKHIVSDLPSEILQTSSTQRELNTEWGYLIPLAAVENQNCWLIGWGGAKYPSRHLILACLNFPTLETANAGIGTRLRMHYHKTSWEYYIALRGRKVLQIEDELVHVETGEILEVPPLVRHNIYHREAPYEGFTIRVPLVGEDDKVED